MLVKQIMRVPLVIDKDISLKMACEVMVKKNISTVVCVHKDKPIGILTKGDIIKNFGRDCRVSEVMSKKLISVSSEDNVSKAIKLIKDKEISSLLVVDSGNLVGFLNLRDLLYNVCDSSDFLIE